HYAPGDALGIVPQNDPVLVAQLIEVGGWSGSETVTVRSGETTLELALTREVEISALTPRFIEQWAERAGAGDFNELAGGERAPFRARTHMVVLMRSRPARGRAARDFAQALRGLQPRLYSVASRPELTPDEVHLCVAPVRYCLNRRDCNVVASTALADRLTVGDSIPDYVQTHGRFQLPADASTPTSMLGAGACVAA